MIRFILNDSLVETAAPPGTPLLDIIRRERGLKGTKLACGEGECGACTVLIGTPVRERMNYHSVTSCISPVGSVAGKHVLTIEGLQKPRGSAVQRKMVECNGTQCGFCTPGFVMSMTGCLLNDEAVSKDKLLECMDGNICRCTGYKSIERAAEGIAEVYKGETKEARFEARIQNGDIPDYVESMHKRLAEIRNDNGINAPIDAVITGGGTDLYVQKPNVMRRLPILLAQSNSQLKGISIEGNICAIGAAETMHTIQSSSVLQHIIPEIYTYLAPVGSTQIRNMATLAGNLINASPIGDLTILLLGLDATISFEAGDQVFSKKLREFYTGYKKMDKPEGALITKIEFEVSSTPMPFHFERVCKRTYLDVASVNSGCMLECDETNTIRTIHLAAGGVAPIPLYLSKTCLFLRGKQISHETIREANEIMQDEVSPISDIRGSANYKRKLLKHQFYLHFSRLSPQSVSLKALLQT